MSATAAIARPVVAPLTDGADPQILVAQGRAEHQAGRLDRAAALYARARAALPNDADLLHLRAALAWQTGHLDAASTLVEAALVQCPALTTAHNTRGVIAQARGQTAAAVDAFEQAYRRSPTSPSYAANLAGALMDAGEPARALAVLHELVAATPQSAAAHRALGDALIRAEKPRQAVGVLHTALMLAPTDLEHRFVLAHACQLAGDPLAAIPHYQHILAIQPEHTRALQNLGRAFSDTGDTDRAFGCLRTALALTPDHAEHWANLAVALRRSGALAASLQHYDKAASLDPGNARTRYHHAMTLLLDGQFDLGWAVHEARFGLAGFPIRRDLLAQPMWDGTKLAGRTLLLHAEQGLGDTIQFARYASLIGLVGLARGGRIVMMVQPPLVELLQGFAGANEVIGSDGPTPAFDVQAPLLSLPRLMRTRGDNIPAALPYLRAETDRRARWRRELDGCGLRVGLVWAGNASHGNDRERSLDPARALQLAERLLHARPDVLLCGLQLGARSQDLDALGQAGRYRNLAPYLQDFAETAALVSELDAVVCVDTSVAHLAGALGRPVMVLLPFAPDWRWRQTGDGTPWYPSMRLCRAVRPGDPEAAIDAAVTQIAGFAGREIAVPQG